ncbi:MAG: hypothetical protein ABW022_09680 [Actinoplanes sp.]
MEAEEAVAAEVTDRSLLELLQEPESEVAASMRKLLSEVNYRQATISSFGSFLS